VGQIELDRRTHERLRFVADLLGVSDSQAVAGLLDRAEKASLSQENDAEGERRIHAVYKATRVDATFDLATAAIEIKSGSLTGRRFDTPSEAAREVVASLNPSVSPHRNGWRFWIVTDSGRDLSSLRHR